MINQLSITNFRSIVHLALSLSYGEAKAPNGYQDWETVPFLERKNGGRVVPLLGMYGANASGKSTIIQALDILQKLLDGYSSTLYMPNRLHPELEHTEFVISGTTCEEKAFCYTIQYDAHEILREELTYNGKRQYLRDKECIDLAVLQQKHYDIARLREIYRVECLNQDGKHICPILGKLARNYSGLSYAVSSVFQVLTAGMRVYCGNSFSSGMGIKVLKNALGGDDKMRAAFAEIEELLRKLDLGIQRMEYNPFLANDEDNPLEAIKTYHNDIAGKEVQFSFTEESMGTQAAFGLLGVCLAALHSGSVLVIDEIDSSLHSLLVAAIVQLFKNKRYNQHGAQLLFSAHNTDLLDHNLLRVSEVAIINKNLRHGTTVKRLCEFEGLRNVNNFRKRYLEGGFSGIPFPYL
jgi:uncharacterized protein